MRALSGGITTDVKRKIAGFQAENCCEAIDRPQKQHCRHGDQGVNNTSGAKLLDTVHVLAANLNRLIQWNKANNKELSSNEKIAKKAGVSSSTVGEMRRADGAVTISSLSKVARVFGVAPWQLLTPGLVPTDPPEVVADEAEKRLLHAFRDRRRVERPPTTTH